MRYFKDRTEAGKLLAEQLTKHDRENCAVLALSEGGVVIGAEIAKKLHASLYLLATETITLPRELVPIATMSSAGTFTYNNLIPTGELEQITTESRAVIDQERLETFQKLNRIIDKDGAIDKSLLKRHTIIVVSDCFNSGMSLDVAADFLKPIIVGKLVVAAPISTSAAVDRMHVLFDEINCLNVLEDLFPVNHYFEDNKLPDHENLINLMDNMSLNW